MKTTEGLTEQLKEENQMEWVCRMQHVEASSVSTVL
ncbi:MAG: TnpV protein [Clostridia bacterium]|nr:TnpV protein [Clostridia bacterium]